MYINYDMSFVMVFEIITDFCVTFSLFIIRVKIHKRLHPVISRLQNFYLILVSVREIHQLRRCPSD